MKNDYYVVSKPLQYLNARNVPVDFHPGHRKILIIIKYFYKADEFVENVKRFDNKWDAVYALNSKKEMYKFILTKKIDSLIYGYDIGTYLRIVCILKSIKFYLIEEGIGTYISTFPTKNKLQFIIDKALGIGTSLGESKYLDAAFVYFPELYKKLHSPSYKVIQFAKPLPQIIYEEIAFLEKISEGDLSIIKELKQKKVLIYVTDWTLNDNIIETIKSQQQNYDVILVKPHPHITDLTSLEKLGLRVLKTNIMVECIFTMLLKQRNELTVLHEGSSSLFYYNGILKGIDMSATRDSMYNKLVRWDEDLFSK